MMTFVDFVETRDYKTELSAYDCEDAEGFVYCDEFVIEYKLEDGSNDERWYMRWFDWDLNKTVARSEKRLRTLERVLYDWAVKNGEIR